MRTLLPLPGSVWVWDMGLYVELLQKPRGSRCMNTTLEPKVYVAVGQARFKAKHIYIYMYIRELLVPCCLWARLTHRIPRTLPGFCKIYVLFEMWVSYRLCGVCKRFAIPEGVECRYPQGLVQGSRRILWRVHTGLA